MEIEKTSTTCTVKHTQICKFLGCDGCEKCTLNDKNVKEFEKQKVNARWELTQEHLPVFVDDFHESEACFFCKKRPGNPKDGYALIELANPEPEYEKGMIFGLGNPQREIVGSMIPFPVAICKDCRKRFNLAENFKFYSAIVGFILGIIITLIFSKTRFMQYGQVPIITILFVMALSYGAGKQISKGLIKKYSSEQYFKLFEVPEMKEMEEEGWFVYREEAEKTRMIFTKKKPRENFCYFSYDFRQPEGTEEGEEMSENEMDTDIDMQ